MKTFEDVELNQTFYHENGAPMIKKSEDRAMHLTPQYTGFNYQESINDVERKVDKKTHVYGIGQAKGWRV